MRASVMQILPPPLAPPRRTRRVAGAFFAAAAAFWFTGRAGAQEACGLCHEDIAKAFQSSRHGPLDRDKNKGWEGKACEACHGSGDKHAESATAADILHPSKLPASRTVRTCLGCHANTPTHVGRIQGGHARNQVGCTSCHTVHQTAAAKVVPAKERCAGCHTGVLAEFQRPHRHRLPEGAMSCTDCHNPHGSFLPRSIQTVSANEAGCLKCHGDKRGPFAFEHAPVRLEGCPACHEPHGSANPKMLVRGEVRQQCLECHANVGASRTLGVVPPAFHDLRSARFQNCTVCHVKVHGSHVNRSLLR